MWIFLFLKGKSLDLERCSLRVWILKALELETLKKNEDLKLKSLEFDGLGCRGVVVWDFWVWGFGVSGFGEWAI